MNASNVHNVFLVVTLLRISAVTQLHYYASQAPVNTLTIDSLLIIDHNHIIAFEIINLFLL